MLLTDARVVTPSGVLPEATITVHEGVITSVRHAAATDQGQSMAGALIVPGFVDIHCHGGGGDVYNSGDTDEARRAAAFHLAHGTTTSLAGVGSAFEQDLHRATEALLPLIADGTLAGIFYEGPYLSAARRGAHHEDHLRAPSLAELARLLAAAGSAARMITIAPELPGALEAIRFAADRGLAVAVGHTDAGYEQTSQAVAAGARVATHLFNGMRPPHHRDPGPVLALLGAQEVICEVIPDGVHLHDGTLLHAVMSAGPERIALITDAGRSAGTGDGTFARHGDTVVVENGVARMASTGALAGSTLTMDVAFRRAVRAGISLTDAARMASATPARAVGLAGIGALEPGQRADLVVLDDDLNVERVMRAGMWLEPSPAVR